MKGLQSRQCHCRSSQVSSGRPSVGQKHVWLMFLLTWSYTTWVVRHVHFLLHRALTIAKWGHSESGGIPNSKWNAQKVFLHVQQCVLQPHPHSSRKAGVHRKEAVELTTFNSPCQNYLIFSGNAWTSVKWGEFFVAFISIGNSHGSCGWRYLHDFSGPQRRVSMWNAMGRSVASNFMFRTCGFCHQNI